MSKIGYGNTQKRRKHLTLNIDVWCSGWHPFGANATLLLRPDIGICQSVNCYLILGKNVCTVLVRIWSYLGWIFDRIALDPGSYFTFVGKASH